jgi:predicted DNA-binding transcriptional regulator AlpA
MSNYSPAVIPVFVDAPGAARLLSMSERWFWAQVSKGLMPAGIKLGAKATRWRAAEVIAAASQYPLAGNSSLSSLKSSTEAVSA